MDERIWCQNDLSIINSYRTRKNVGGQKLISVPHESLGLRGRQCMGWALWLLCLVAWGQILGISFRRQNWEKKWGNANDPRKQTLVIWDENTRQEEKGGQEERRAKEHAPIQCLFMCCWSRTGWLCIASKGDENRAPALSKLKSIRNARVV